MVQVILLQLQTMYSVLKLMTLWYLEKLTMGPSPILDPRSYDTVLSGGDLQFSTAKGINP